MKRYPICRVTFNFNPYSLKKELIKGYKIHENDAEKVADFLKEFRTTDDDFYGTTENFTYVHDLILAFMGVDCEKEDFPNMPDGESLFNFYYEHYLKYYNNSDKNAVFNLLTDLSEIEESGVDTQLERYW